MHLYSYFFVWASQLKNKLAFAVYNPSMHNSTSNNKENKVIENTRPMPKAFCMNLASGYGISSTAAIFIANIYLFLRHFLLAVAPENEICWGIKSSLGECVEEPAGS